MSDSVALVRQVVESVKSVVEVDDQLVEKMATRKGVSTRVARLGIIASAAKRALALTKDDVGAATTALVVVNGKANRLPQCVKLLRKHGARTVRTAYELKDELMASNISLRHLCELVRTTDEDSEGEALKLRALLEEVAMKAVSKEQEYALHHRIEEMLDEGHLLETIEDKILGDLRTELRKTRAFLAEED